VARRGVMLGSIVTDLPIEMIERYDLHANVKTLWSRWNWSDEFFAGGFDRTLVDPDHLATVWKRAQTAGAGPGHWYEDPEALLYCFYDVGSAAARTQDATATPAEDRPAVSLMADAGQDGVAASAGAAP
jgi:hypothetical protein